MSDNSDNTNTDNTDDTSLLGNLKNKLTYKLHNAAYDPNANKFAAERAKKIKEEEEKKKQEKTDKTTDNNGDPNKFSIKRVLKKTGNQALDIIKKVTLPFLSLMLAMIVANDLIVYSPPIRIIFFIFTFFVCLFPPATMLLGIFYLLKSGYSYYVNHMTDRPKKEIIPTIYALLPITTYQPTSMLGSFFLYPFTYPKNDVAAAQLPKTMKQYWDDLQASFPDIDKVKNLPIFATEIKQIQKDLSELHEPKGFMMKFGDSGSEPIPNTNNTTKPISTTKPSIENTSNPSISTSKVQTNNSSQVASSSGSQVVKKLQNVANKAQAAAATTSSIVGSIAATKSALASLKQKPNIIPSQPSDEALSNKPKATINAPKPPEEISSNKPKATVNAPKPPEEISSNKPKLGVNEPKPEEETSANKPKAVDELAKPTVVEPESAKPTKDVENPTVLAPESVKPNVVEPPKSPEGLPKNKKN
jgi:hypothetical protein